MNSIRLQLVAFLLLALCGQSAIAQEEPYDYATWRQFWSFKPVQKPALPAVKDKQWPRNAIDHFILAKLEAQGLKPAPQADKYTLIRRATFDLTGLPPTRGEIEAFIKDTSPDAYDKLIIRLLASPHYGERYGRHWLDVVRYEQGKVKLPGVKNTRGELDFRDYVIRSFNSDKPYDQLITEHLAGDLLPAPTAATPEDRQRYFDQLTATAFLSIGNWFDECTDPNQLKLDIIDEQINTVSKAFLGLTVSCARCHDHKYDPITERDYYALAGIFASTRIIDVFNENWKDGRVRLTREKAMPDEVAAKAALRHKVLQRREQTWNLKQQALEGFKRNLVSRAKEIESVVSMLPKVEVRSFEAEQFAGQSNLRIVAIKNEDVDVEVLEAQTPGDQWVKYELKVDAEGVYALEALHTGDQDHAVAVQVGGMTVVPSITLADTLGRSYEHRRWTKLGDLKLRQGVNTIRLAPAVKDETFPRIDRLRWYRVPDSLDVAISSSSEKLNVSPVFLREILLDPQMKDFTAAALPVGVVDEKLAAQIEESTAVILALRERLASGERLIAVTDHEAPTDLPIHIGGDTYRVSKSTVPRAMPVLFEHAVKPPALPANQSGRLELAKWLTDPNHPLTSRVMVNRLWQYHFGHGIVDSANDFGSRGSAPTHPELLEWLAATFVEEGWSMKKMHHLIMTSATYRQSNSSKFQVPSSKLEQSDSAGTWNLEPGTWNFFSPFPRRRLEVEAIYDAMLVTTGKVVRQPAGQPLDFNRSADRMIYVLTSNRSPVGLGGEIRKMFSVFDYDPTGEPIGKRDESTTAAQSLFWLNNPIPKHFAGEFAKVILRDERFNDAELLRRAYLTAIGREPDEAMSALLLNYLENSTKQGFSREDAWTQVCLAIYASSEFRYLD